MPPRKSPRFKAEDAPGPSPQRVKGEAVPISKESEFQAAPRPVCLPSQTVYVNGLPSKAPSSIKSLLYEFFAAYGSVIAIQAGSAAQKKRGQAWVTFSTIPEATTAVLKLAAGFDFLGAHGCRVDIARVESKAGGIYRGEYVVGKL